MFYHIRCTAEGQSKVKGEMMILTWIQNVFFREGGEKSADHHIIKSTSPLIRNVSQISLGLNQKPI